MGLSRSIGSLVVRIVADGLGAYKAEMNAIADTTEKSAGKIDKAAKVVDTATGAMGGGMGNAAEAATALNTAAGVAGLGLGVLAVGAAATAYAAYKGAQEQVEYQKALILTGNAAGTTAGQMADMARHIGDQAGTVHDAATALTAMAATGQVAGGMLEKSARVAAEEQRVLGTSVNDTAKRFAELGDDPVRASLKLNESMHYLTASTYTQIKAAQDLGDEDRAATLAQEAYADATLERLAAVQENVGYLEKAWKGLRGVVTDTWDAMMGLGREATVQQKIDALREGISEARASGSGADSTGKPLAALEAELVYMQRIAAGQQSAAVRVADYNKRQENSIALAERKDKFAEKDVQRQREIAAAQNELANSNLSAADYANYEQAVVGIANRYKETEVSARGAKKAVAEFEKAQEALRKSYTAQAQAVGDLRNKEYEGIEKYMAAQRLQSLEAANAADASVRAAQVDLDNHGMLRSAVADLTALKLEQKLVNLTAGTEEYDNLQRQIKAQRELAGIYRQGEARDAAEELARANKTAAEESGRYWESALMRAFESGKGFWESLWSTIKNTLKTQVLKVSIQAVMGSAGSLAGTAASAASSSGSGLLGTLSNASSLANLATGGYSSLLGSGVAALFGQTAGNAAIATALTGSASSAAAAASAAATAGGAAASAATSAATIGSTIATAFPYVAAAVAIASLFGGSKKKASSSTGGTQSSYDASGNRTSYNPYYDTAAGTTKLADDMVQSLQDTYMATAKKLGIATAATTFTYAGNTGKNGADPQFYLGGSAGNSTFYQDQTQLSDTAVQLAATRAVVAALKGSGLPEYLSGVFDDITVSAATQTQLDTTLSYAQSLASLHTALEGLPFDKLTNASYDTMQGMLAAAGGVDAFSTSLAAYYQAYYSETERLAVTTANVSKVFADLNMAMPTSKDALREVIDGLDLTTTKGQAAYATLLNVAPAFASVADAVASMTDSVLGEAKRIRGLSAGDTPASFAAAQSAFAINTAQARAGDETALAALPSLSQALLTLAEANAVSAVDLARVRAQTAASLEATASTVAGKYGLKLPSFDVGTNYVPRDMIAQIHEGEAITPKAYNPAAGGRSAGGNADLLAALQALSDQFDDVHTAIRAVASHSEKTAKLLRRVTGDGEAMQTVAA